MSHLQWEVGARVVCAFNVRVIFLAPVISFLNYDNETVLN